MNNIFQLKINIRNIRIIINSITLRGKYLNLIFCTKCDQVMLLTVLKRYKDKKNQITQCEIILNSEQILCYVNKKRMLDFYKI